MRREKVNCLQHHPRRPRRRAAPGTIATIASTEAARPQPVQLRQAPGRQQLHCPLWEVLGRADVNLKTVTKAAGGQGKAVSKAADGQEKAVTKAADGQERQWQG